MDKSKNSIERLVKDQVKKWESSPAREKRKLEIPFPVITVSMEPGSGGSLVAQQVAERLGFDYFHRGIVESIAKRATIRAA